MKKITKHLTPANFAIVFAGLLAGGLVALAGVWRGAFATLFTWIVLFGLHWRYMAALETRMAADLSLAWSVWLNGVPVGEIPDAEFAKIRHRVVTSANPYIHQLTNLITTLFCAWYRVSACGLVLAFWVVLVLSWADPSVPQQVIQGLQNAENAKSLVPTFVLFMLIVYGGVFMFGGSLKTFGWSNQFRKETGRYLRHFFKSQVVDPEYVVGRFDATGAFVDNDEMNYLKRTGPKFPSSAINID